MSNDITAWGLLRDLHQVCIFTSREKPGTGVATNSELKRWINNKALIINGETVTWDEPIDFPIISVVLFPKHPITIY